MQEDFITSYLDYTSDTEVPAIFSRWAAIVGLGAYLGRQIYLPFGHSNIYTNQYCMLIGTPGTRKGTAIKVMKKLLGLAGYKTFSAERTSKEKFLLDLAGGDSAGLDSVEDLLSKNLWNIDDADSRPDCEMFIAIDEFNDFLGNGNIEFISMLGNLWDYGGVYTNRIKTGKSVEINNPTISILGGNTPTNFSLAFPPEILGQGFFSRLLLIYGEPNGKRIAFPKPIPAEHTAHRVELLKRIKATCMGATGPTITATRLLDKIYTNYSGFSDVRFESYVTRRFTHLLKLCIITTASRRDTRITEADVIYANTMLYHAERLMPKALGEFGKAKNSDISHKIITLANAADTILTFKEIWRHVSSDLERMSDLATMLQNLCAADKLQQVNGGAGFLPKRRMLELGTGDTIDMSLLTVEEQEMRE